MTTLEIMPAGLANAQGEPLYSLVIRAHDLGGTEYENIANVTLEKALRIVSASNGSINWLYGPPTEESHARYKSNLELWRQKAKTDAQ